MFTLPLVQILPCHPRHATALFDTLPQMGFKNVRVSASRRLKPGLIVATTCPCCRQSKQAHLDLHLNRPLASIVIVDFKHQALGCNIQPTGVVRSNNGVPDLADQFIRALTQPPKHEVA